MIYIMIFGGIGYMLYKLVEVTAAEYILMWANVMENHYEETIASTNNIISSTGMHLPFIRDGE